jgi:import inner membrane translocase subunit TIM21
MILTFWVHGRGKDEAESFGWLKSSWNTVEAWGREAAIWAGVVETEDQIILNDGRGGQTGSIDKAVGDPATGSNGGGLGRWLGGLVSLRVPDGKGRAMARGLPPPGTFTDGEVQGDYVKVGIPSIWLRMLTCPCQNAAGTYQLLSLVVNIPSSHSAHPSRAVIHWSPEADTEGLVGPRPR